MNAKRVWIHVGLVALIAGGFAAGILYHRHGMQLHGVRPAFRNHPAHADDPAHGDDAVRFLEHFRRRLDLTDEQAGKVKSILDSVHLDMTGLTKEFHERFETIRGRAWEDIRATLGEAQLSEFVKLVEEMEKDHRGHR